MMLICMVKYEYSVLLAELVLLYPSKALLLFWDDFLLHVSVTVVLQTAFSDRYALVMLASLGTKHVHNHLRIRETFQLRQLAFLSLFILIFFFS